jgi:hypothetical protein
LAAVYLLLQKKRGSVLLLGDAVSINYYLIKLVRCGRNKTGTEIKSGGGCTEIHQQSTGNALFAKSPPLGVIS